MYKDIYLYIYLFSFEVFTQWKETMFSEPEASFVFVGAALTFLPIGRQTEVKMMLAHEQK